MAPPSRCLDFPRILVRTGDDGDLDHSPTFVIYIQQQEMHLIDDAPHKRSEETFRAVFESAGMF